MKSYLFTFFTFLIVIPITVSFFGSPLEAKPGVNNGVVVYRSFNSYDYLFSTDPLEGPKAGFFPQEARFRLFSSPSSNTATLYRCFLKDGKKSSHFLSTDTNCEGQINEGPLGFLATVESQGLVPLNRYVNLKTKAHVSTIPGDTENLSDWKLEGVQGYVTAVPIPPVTLTPDDGKKYFSFYAGAMDGVGDRDFIPELADTSNLIFIRSPFVESQHFENRLIECEKFNLKAIITFDWVFLDENHRLKGNYAEFFIQKVEPVLKRHLNTVVAFYGLDEPYFNGRIKGISDAETYNAQETMGRFLKSRFPNIPIGVILSAGEVEKNNPLFPSFDWFGFDCYVKKSKCGSSHLRRLLNTLNSSVQFLTANDSKPRFLMVVPQAGHSKKYSTKKGLKHIRSQVANYREIIRGDSRVKVVMPFIWQSFNDGTANWTGTREIPEAMGLYKDFYLDFLSGDLF